jgi:ubiquinone/menaquinone biosynthesis C-methylase UbiE
VIEFTGERVVPGQVDADLWAEHLSRYAFASRWSAGSRVLDIGCGTGYGTAELAAQARHAIGIDVSPEAINHARSAYRLPKLRFIRASATALPFADASFNLVTAFEVIEHLADWRALLGEAHRVLHPDGVFLVSTPNQQYYTESRGSTGPNPFHTHEFEYGEFQSALAEFFPQATVLVQNHLETFAFYQEGGEARVQGRMDGVRGTPEDAHFFLGVCSLRSTPAPEGFLFVHRGSNVLREREKHIESLERELAEARAQFAALQRAHDELTHHLQEQNQWALRTVEELAAARERIRVVQDELEDRTRWALKLSARVQDFEARWNLLRASRWIKLGRKLNLGPNIEDAPTGKGDGTGDRT